MSNNERLWAPWRMEYVKSPKDEGDGCVFCTRAEADNDRKNLILYRGKHNFIIMNLYPYNNAHLMVVPFSHVSDTFSLDDEVLSEMITLADKSMQLLKEFLNPQGFNFGANIGAAGGAGIEEHVHFHVIPRWTGDTNFMPVIGQTKVMVQGIHETYDDLKPLFDKLN